MLARHTKYSANISSHNVERDVTPEPNPSASTSPRTKLIAAVSSRTGVRIPLEVGRDFRRTPYFI